MSLHFNPSAVGVVSSDDWSITVCAWRGCCLEVFSRAEHAVADCLSALETAGIALTAEARNPSAVTRLRALADCLARYRFAGHERKARELVAEWEQLVARRPPLAHGRLVAHAAGVTIHHRAFDGKKETVSKPQILSNLEMLSQLNEMARVQVALHKQLGQIKAAAPKAVPLPT